MTPPTPEESEYFPTPAWSVHRMAEAVTLPWPTFGPVKYLDPCVGGGALPRAIAIPVQWTTMDIRDVPADYPQQDYLSCDLDALGRFDVALMNPPFTKALHFVDRALKHCDLVIALQKLNWLATEERAEWMREHTPAVYVLPNRIDFDGRGGDSNEYCWFVWGAGHAGVHILRSTPLETRSAQKPQYQAPVSRQIELF